MGKATGPNTGNITRDFDFMDVILPGRVKNVEEWIRKMNYQGGRASAAVEILV
jgi:hypothetical protein